MSTKATYAIENGYEEFIETGLDECLLSEAQSLISKFSQTEGNCAMTAGVAAVSAIGQGISMYVSYKVSEILVDNMVKKMGAYWAYINMGKLKKFIKSKIGNVPFLGKAGGFLLKNVLLSDTTGNRIETMKLAQKEVERFDTHSFEHQKIMSGNMGNLDRKKQNLLQLRDNKKVQNIELFRYKTLTSSWTNSTFDKKTFEAVTGQKIKNTGTTSWAKKYKELNTLSTFAKDLEGDLVSHAQILLDTLTMQKINRMN